MTPEYFTGFLYTVQVRGIPVFFQFWPPDVGCDRDSLAPLGSKDNRKQKLGEAPTGRASRIVEPSTFSRFSPRPLLTDATSDVMKFASCVVETTLVYSLNPRVWSLVVVATL